MKKLLLLFAMVAGSVAAWADSTVTPTLTVDGTTANLSVALNNDQNFIAFQMDITMSDLGKTYDNGAATISSRLQSTSTATVDGNPANFIIATNWVSQGVLRVVAYNLGNVAINGTAGDEIFNIDITTSAEFANAEDWTATLSNVIFVTEEMLAEIELPTATAVGESGAILMGDANGDGSVDAVDLDLVIAAAATDDYSQITLFKAVDFDGNSTINAVDVAAEIEAVANF